MSKILFKNEEINKIIKLYQIDGKTQKEISEIFNCGIKPIRRILKENNIQINTRRTNRILIQNYFSNIDTPSKAYLIGLLFTDGNISNSPKRESMVRIQLLKEDINILEFFKNEIHSNSAIINNNDNTCTFEFRSNLVAQDLSNYNIVPNKTYKIKQLPKNIPLEYYIDFLRGIIDGDGSLYFTSSDNSFHLSFTSHYIELVQDYINIISYFLNIDLSKRYPTFYNNVAKFTLNGKEAYNFATLLYKNANIYCKRKYDKYLLAKQKYLTSV